MGRTLAIILAFWVGTAEAANVHPTPVATATPAPTATPMFTATPAPTATPQTFPTPANTATAVPTPTPYTAYDTNQDEGTPTTAWRIWNCIGDLIACASDAGNSRTNITITNPTPRATDTPAPTATPANTPVPTATVVPTPTPIPAVATPAITSNTLAKGTYLQDSAITDNGSGALGFYPAAASPQAVTITYASGSGTDKAGANEVINLSGSTGTGLGGNLAVANTNKAGTGSAANTYGNVLTLSPPNTGTTAPVNYIDLKNAITGSGPSFTATGTDSNIPINLVSKGTGSIIFPVGAAATPSLSITGDTGTGIWGTAGSSHRLAVSANGNTISEYSTQGEAFATAATMCWIPSGTVQTTGCDMTLLRGGAGILRITGTSSASANSNGTSGITGPIGLGSGGTPGLLTISGGTGNSAGTSNGGAITLIGGTPGATAGVGGATTVGGPTSIGTDAAAGAMTIKGGIGTGAAVPGPVSIQTTSVLGTGTTAQTLADRLIIGNEKVVTNNTGTAMVNMTLASNTTVAATASYSCQVFDGTDVQIEEGSIVAHATNKAGTFANNNVTKYGNQQDKTAGTLTVTWTITAANPAVLTVNCNSSLTPSAGYPKVRYNFTNLTDQAVAVQ